VIGDGNCFYQSVYEPERRIASASEVSCIIMRNMLSDMLRTIHLAADKLLPINIQLSEIMYRGRS
jgi:hypothetical protein